MRMNRFYFHIKFWLLDRVVHTIFVSVVGWRVLMWPKQYKKYLNKDSRFKFQVDLGIALLNYAIGAELEDLSNHRLNGCVQRIGFPESVRYASSVS